MTGIIIKIIKEFLEVRGLSLNLDKTKVIDLKTEESGFKFLGIRYYTTLRRKGDKRSLQDQTIKREDLTTLMVPDPTKVEKFKESIKEYLRGALNRSIKEIIKELNPRIRG